MTDHTIEDLSKTYSEISSIRNSQKFIIENLIKNGLAKVVYFVDGIDGWYNHVELTSSLVTSNDKEFIKSLHHLKLSLDEDMEYYDYDNNPIYTKDVQYFCDVPYMLDMKIVPFRTRMVNTK